MFLHEWARLDLQSLILLEWSTRKGDKGKIEHGISELFEWTPIHACNCEQKVVGEKDSVQVVNKKDNMLNFLQRTGNTLTKDIS